MTHLLHLLDNLYVYKDDDDVNYFGAFGALRGKEKEKKLDMRQFLDVMKKHNVSEDDMLCILMFIHDNKIPCIGFYTYFLDDTILHDLFDIFKWLIKLPSISENKSNFSRIYELAANFNKFEVLDWLLENLPDENNITRLINYYKRPLLI